MLNIIIKVFVWFILFMAVLEVAAGMLTAANTIQAILGLVIVVAFFILSWKTLFFTKIHIKFNKKEKEE